MRSQLCEWGLSYAKSNKMQRCSNLLCARTSHSHHIRIAQSWQYSATTPTVVIDSLQLPRVSAAPGFAFCRIEMVTHSLLSGRKCNTRSNTTASYIPGKLKLKLYTGQAIKKISPPQLLDSSLGSISPCLLTLLS